MKPGMLQALPLGIATVTPQIFTVASWPVVTSRPEVPPSPHTAGGRVRAATSPYPPDLSWWAVKGRQTLISRVHLLVSLTGPASSGSADTSRRCQGCSTLTSISWIRLPSAHPAAATTRQRRSLTSIRLQTPRGARGLQPNHPRQRSSIRLLTLLWCNIIQSRRTPGGNLMDQCSVARHPMSRLRTTDLADHSFGGGKRLTCVVGVRVQ